MNKHNPEETHSQRTCQKCKTSIGGKPYYIVQLDCIYDGNTLSSCEKIIICSDCFHTLKSWLNLS
jgi:hypothetical protein